MPPADLKSQLSKTYNKRVELKFNKVQPLTEAQSQGTQRKHHDGPRLESVDTLNDFLEIWKSNSHFDNCIIGQYVSLVNQASSSLAMRHTLNQLNEEFAGVFKP